MIYGLEAHGTSVDSDMEQLENRVGTLVSRQSSKVG